MNTILAQKFENKLLGEIRDKFEYVDSDPYSGRRVYFENGGGSLTLKSVIEQSSHLMALGDASDRLNPAALNLNQLINKGFSAVRCFMGAERSDGQLVSAATGTDLLFRLIRVILMNAGDGNVVSSDLEHPATRDAAYYFSKKYNKDWRSVPINPKSASVTAEDYTALVTHETCLVTIIHTSHVTGMTVDLIEITSAIRKISPDCFIVCDGIQHAPHSVTDAPGSGVDAYVFAPYKAFSHHGVAFGWISDRLSSLEHEKLTGSRANNWSLGQRNPGAISAQYMVENYLLWLGNKFTNAKKKRNCIIAAMDAISRHEASLIQYLIEGDARLLGLKNLDGVSVIGQPHNENREGAVSFSVNKLESATVVDRLEKRGIRTYCRKSDVYSGHILKSIGQSSCVRVSFAHYNSIEEVKVFLSKFSEILKEAY